MRAAWATAGLIAGLLFGPFGCKDKGPQREELACVGPSCEGSAVAEPCQCEPGMICLAGDCRFCSEAAQCESRPCNPSGRCEPLPCALDEHCPIAEICDGGQCVHASTDSRDTACGIAAVYFAYDSAKLTPNNQERLSVAAPCLLEALAVGGELVLEAHADRLGSEDYSLGLSERRGASVRDFLVGMGVPAERVRVVGKGALEAGQGHASRAEDRRVELRIAP
jgi:peptidoglycan-associated lipoprotein